jgi:hypothetical protein
MASMSCSSLSKDKKVWAEFLAIKAGLLETVEHLNGSSPKIRMNRSHTFG